MTLNEQIIKALDIACGNGYDFHLWSAEQIAVDLIDHDVDFQSYEPEQLMPGIEEWLWQQKPIM